MKARRKKIISKPLGIVVATIEVDSTQKKGINVTYLIEIFKNPHKREKFPSKHKKYFYNL